MPEGKQILIVGGGLAGCCMARESLRAGHHVTMLDNAFSQAPSRVAAGLFNIITGRVASKTWQATDFLEALEELMTDPDLPGLHDLYHLRTIYRPYKTISEHNEWFFKTKTEEYRDITRHGRTAKHTEAIHNPFGGLSILPCGWVDAGKMVDRIKEGMLRAGRFEWRKTEFKHKMVEAESGRVHLENGAEVFDEIVFSEGPAIKDNPFFQFVEIRPLKGQTLEITMPGLPRDLILLRKVYMVPRGSDRYVVGSTYEKKFTDLRPTSEGIAALKEYVAAATPLPFQVEEARAGIRPTTPNRRPVCGRHPRFPRLVLFNGLGTKGVLQAPWCARHLRQYLDGEISALLPELDIRRFG